MLSFQEFPCLLFCLNTEQCLMSHKDGFLLQIPEINCILNDFLFLVNIQQTTNGYSVHEMS